VTQISGEPPVTSIHREMINVQAYCTAFGRRVQRVAITATIVAPVSAQDKMKSEMSGEKTVMVGGAAMFPRRTSSRMP